MSASTGGREAIFQAKKELRKAMKRKLGGLSADVVARQCTQLDSMQTLRTC